MSKRLGKGGPAPPPPLPSGPQPVPDQATINAAWANYYASQGMVPQTAQTPVTPASAPASANTYQNYGYGPGANMPGQATMGAGMNMHMGAAGAGGQVYGRPQNPQMSGVNMGMNMGHTGHGMAMGAGGMGMQGTGALGMGMQGQAAYAPQAQTQYAAPAQAQYAGMYGQQQPVHTQQQTGIYGMQAMPTYTQPQQPMNAAPAAGPVRPYRPLAQAQVQQPYGAPGAYSSIQPAGPMTPMGPAQPGANYQGNMGGRRPGGPGPGPGGPGGPMNGANGNFPPAKRPRMEGPPANRIGGPGPVSGPAPAGPRSAPAGMGMGPGPGPGPGPSRRGPPSDYGGSIDGGSRPSNVNGPPRGSSRGRGFSSVNATMTRGVAGAGRGRGGSYASGPSDAGSIRGSPRSTRGTSHGAAAPLSSSYRGRGGKHAPSSTPSGPSGIGAPRAPRNGTRGSAPGRGGHASSRLSEPFGHHRQYQGHAGGSSTTSRTAPQAPAGSSGKSRANPARSISGKSRPGEDGESAAYQEERTRVAREDARKRTMTDFRIIGLEIKQLGWKWGAVRDLEAEEFEGEDTESGESDVEENEGDDVQDKSDGIIRKDEPKDAADSVLKAEPSSESQEAVGSGPTDTPGLKVEPEEATSDDAKAVKLESEQHVKKEVAEEETIDQVDTTTKPLAESETRPSESTDEVVKKRGEKRKAKMSSPDVEDDARIVAKKRNTHGAANRMLDASTTAPAPEKNRFRIYFASPVERGDGISLNAYSAEKAEYSGDDEEQEPAEGNGDEEVQGEVEDTEETGVPAFEEELPEGPESQTAVEAEASLHDQPEDENQEDQAHIVVPEDTMEHETIDDALPPDDGGRLKEVLQETDEPQEGTAAESAEGDLGEDAKHIPEDVESTPAVELEAETLADVSMMTAEGDAAEDEPEVKPAQKSILDDAEGAQAADAESDHVPVETTEETADTQEGQAQQPESSQVMDSEVLKDTAEAEKGNLKVSAENVSAAYSARRQPPVAPSGPLAHSLTSHPFRRSPSLPPTSSDVPVPAPNRLSILYADGTRRIVLDAPIVQAVQIHRRRGLIKVRISGVKQAGHEKQVEHLAKKTEEMNVAVSGEESEQVTSQGGDEVTKRESVSEGEQDDEAKADEARKPKPPMKGILLEALNEEANVFGLGSSSAAAVSDGDETSDFPPLDQLSSESTEVIELTAFLDTAHRLSEPRWVKSGQLEDWISTIKSRETADEAEENWRWRRKLEIVDPEAPATLASVLETWAMKSKIGSLKERRRFLNTHMKDANEFLNILLQAIRGDIAPLSRSQIQHSHSILKKASRPTSVHYESQTYLTLAVMALVNLLQEYAAKTGEKASKLDDKIAEIIKSLPNPIIYSNTDKVFQDWYKSLPAHHKRKPGK